MRREISIRILLLLLLGSIVTLAFNVHVVMSDYSWSETIYIGADGSVTPSEAPISTVDNVTYTFIDNIVDAAPSLYDVAIIVERDNLVLDGANYTLQGPIGLWSVGLQLTGRRNVTIRDLAIRQFYYGIRLASSSGITVSRNNITNNYEAGVDLAGSHANVIAGNQITSSDHNGIYLEDSHNNTISRNYVAHNVVDVSLYQSSNNSIARNTITDANTCVYVRATCTGNTVSGNNITEAHYNGVYLHGSSNTTISENNITNNGLRGIHIAGSSGNRVYHNNFMANAAQIYLEAGDGNTWDCGYPSGGNYWSDYTERYPNATEIDGTGIWDTPYELDPNNQDHYPLVHMVPEFPSILVLSMFMIATLLVVMLYRRKRSE